MFTATDDQRASIKRAWTKRDQREWLNRIPVLLAEPVRAWNGSWLWQAWCPFCKTHHRHGPAPGHRTEHCTDNESPFRRTGYVLRLDPRFKELNDLCQLQMRAKKLRKQRIVERKEGALAQLRETSNQKNDGADANSAEG